MTSITLRHHWNRKPAAMAWSRGRNTTTRIMTRMSLETRRAIKSVDSRSDSMHS